MLCVLHGVDRSTCHLVTRVLTICVVQVEEFDYFIRKKDQAKATDGLAEVKSALDRVRAALPV